MRLVTAYVGLGANLNHPEQQVEQALSALDQLPRARVVARSALYQSDPLGPVPAQPEFINAVACLGTYWTAPELLQALLDVEARSGRRRDGVPGGARVLDLDLLLYGQDEIDEAGLAVPHPRLHERRFVLEPLFEIAPDLLVPGRGPVAELLAACKDQAVNRLGSAPAESADGTVF